MLNSQKIAKHITNPKLELYKKYGDVIKVPQPLKKQKESLLIFQDNGADVLAVAHLDYVMWNKPNIGESYIVNCPQLDDRLGVAIILEWLHTLGKFDILLCDDEEIGDSTGQYFTPSKQYRYMVEFDRAGSDCVFYQYSKEELEYTFSECGWDIGFGTFSDIAFMSDLGCQGVNIGVGYHKAHTKSCYASLAETNSQLARFAVWHYYYGDRTYEYEDDGYSMYSRYSGYGSSSSYSYDDELFLPASYYKEKENIVDPKQLG